MRLGRKLSATAVASVMLVCAAAERVSADDGAGAYVPSDGSPTAVVTEIGAGGDGGSTGGDGEGGESDCWWEVQIADDSTQPVYDVDGTRLHSATGRWLAKFCGSGELVDQQPEGEQVDIDALAREAARSVVISSPLIQTSPKDRQLYVQIPTWLWIAGSWWHDYQATASTGRVTATVTAAPTSVSWTTGDGATISCDGPGRAWSPGLDDDDSDCRHTYRHSTGSDGSGALPLRATVTFSLSWTSNIGAGGDLDPITRSSTVEVTVGEIQAIETE